MLTAGEGEACHTGTWGDDNQSMAQIWFRAPKLWNEFLEDKASREFCSKSDLLRRAFRLTYGTEMEGFRVNPGVVDGPGRDGSSPDKGMKWPGNDLTLSNLFAPVVYNIEEDPWIEGVAAFVANKRSPQTHRVYRTVLKQFFDFVAKHPSDVKQSDIIKYRHHLESLGRAPSTIRQHLATVSGYYTFCIARNLTIYNPVRGVSRPTVGGYISATWLDKDQAKALLAQPNLGTLKGKRDYAILVLLLLTGLRRRELANIRGGDIQERGGKRYLSYTAKGGIRLVRDIPVKCWEAVERYLNDCDRDITDDAPLFVATTEAGDRLRRYYGKDESNGYHPITPEAIRQLVIKYARRAFGEGVKVSPHTLRHTAGTLLRKSGRSIEEVQSFLKHKRVDTTRAYLHVVEATDAEFGECIAQMLEL
jgi:integrase/recombinase XerD